LQGVDPRSAEGRRMLALPFDLGYGKVFWSSYDQAWKVQHHATKQRGKGGIRQETPCLVCSKQKCRDAAKVAAAEKQLDDYGCFLEHLLVKEAMIAALKVKEETGKWGRLRNEIIPCGW